MIEAIRLQIEDSKNNNSAEIERARVARIKQEQLNIKLDEMDQLMALQGSFEHNLSQIKEQAERLKKQIQELRGS